MPRKRYSVDAPYNGTTRRADGLTVVASNAATREQRALVRRDMPLRVALRDVCATLDGWPGDWRVDVISTPTTIYTDLRGRAGHSVHPVGMVKLFGAEGESPAEPPLRPEVKLLGVVGRLDLLA
jgi:hypothetical protein